MVQKFLNLPAAVVQNLQQLFTFVEADKVKEYIENYPGLVAFLQEAYVEIRKCFPTKQLVLKVRATNRTDTGSELVILIQAIGKRWQATPNFNQFKNDWWFKTQQQYEEVSIYPQYDEAEPGDPWDIIESMIGTVPAPSDWSAEHDHYIHGTPKRGNDTTLFERSCYARNYSSCL